MKYITNENSKAICEKVIACMKKEIDKFTPDELFPTSYLLLSTLIQHVIKGLKNSPMDGQMKKSIQDMVDIVLQILPIRKEDKTMEYPINESSVAIWEKVMACMEKETNKVTPAESIRVSCLMLDNILPYVVKELKNYHPDENIKKIIQAMMDINLRDEYEPPKWIS